MSPIFFVICWFDDVLLILIHGFVLFRVDLAPPHVSPLSIHEISSILTTKSPISAQNCVPNLGSTRRPTFTGRPNIPEAPDDRHLSDDQCHPTEWKLTDFRSFRTSVHLRSITYETPDTCRYWLRLIFVSAITNSSELWFWRSLAHFEAIEIPHPTKYYLHHFTP